MQVAVCVITYRRAQGLTRLLDGLNRLTFQGDPPDVRCIVVDNDEAGAAAEVCDEIRSRFRWPLRYEVEPRHGIPYARNRAVASVGDEVDFVAFIDDDEVPEPSWLDELLGVQDSHYADVVAGPVIPHFEEDVPTWVVKGRLFDHYRYATGHRLEVAFTNNVLVRREVFDRFDKPFDERMALSGGSDWHCFMRIHRAGYVMVWADAAVVYEWVPSSRTNVRWMCQRFYRQGTTYSFCHLDFQRSWRTRVELIVRGCAWVFAGLFLMPFGLVAGRHKWAKYLRAITYGVGTLTGIVGMRFEEYRQTHGT